MAHKPTDLRPLSVRMPEKLRARLDQASKRHDRSMNAEILYRLENSFTYENAFDSGELYDIAIEMIVAFRSAGAGAAYSNGHGVDWLSDPHCYRTAAFAVLNTLMLREPEAARDPEEVLLQCEALKSAILTHVINAKRKGPKP